MKKDFFDITFKQIYSNFTYFSKSKTSQIIREAEKNKLIESKTLKNRKHFNKKQIEDLLIRKSKEVKAESLGDYKTLKEKYNAELAKLKLKKEKIELKVLEKKYIDTKIVKKTLTDLALHTKDYFENNVSKISSKITQQLNLNNEQLQEVSIIIENEFERFIASYADFIEEKIK